MRSVQCYWLVDRFGSVVIPSLGTRSCVQRRRFEQSGSLFFPRGGDISRGLDGHLTHHPDQKHTPRDPSALGTRSSAQSPRTAHSPTQAAEAWRVPR